MVTDTGEPGRRTVPAAGSWASTVRDGAAVVVVTADVEVEDEVLELPVVLVAVVLEVVEVAGPTPE